LEDELRLKIEAFDIEGVRRQAFKRKRAEALIGQVRATIDTRLKAAAKDMQGELRELADIQGKAVVNIGNKVLGGEVLTTAFTRKDLVTLANNEQILGGPAREWWGAQNRTLQRRFGNEIRMGVLGGETNQQLVQRIRGTATGKRVKIFVRGKAKFVPEFQGGIIQTSTRNANALVRTSVQSVSNDIMMQTYRENADVIKGVQALATLDNRTTEICMARSGAVWDLDGVPFEDSPIQDPFPGPPPWHFNCRSVLIPITKSWEQLLEESGERKIKGLKEKIGPRTRASMDGQVSSKLNYERWLSTKSKAFQIDVLGPGKWKLWNEGKIGLAQLIDQSGNPLSLRQLRARTGVGSQVKKVVRKRPSFESLSKVGDTLPVGTDFRAVQAAKRNEFVKIIEEHQKNIGATPLRVVTNTPPSTIAPQVNEAKDWLSRVASNKTIDAKSLEFEVNSFVGRAHATQGTSGVKHTINLNGFADKAPTAVHEMGHVLEYSNPKAKAAAVSFLKKRGGQYKPLGGRFDADEFWLEGEYVDKYVGKVYGHKGSKPLSKKISKAEDINNEIVRSTEVISMGLEYMYRSPDWFLKNDPEHFNLILDMLLGGL
jgi:SPP1 gp7 family putative phage head morphogenesis protein